MGRGANRTNVQHVDETPPEVVEVSGARMVVEVDGTAKVGDVLPLGPGSGYARLPDGTVVTIRREYLLRHVGVHVFFAADDMTDTVTIDVVPATTEN